MADNNPMVSELLVRFIDFFKKWWVKYWNIFINLTETKKKILIKYYNIIKLAFKFQKKKITTKNIFVTFVSFVSKSKISCCTMLCEMTLLWFVICELSCYDGLSKIQKKWGAYISKKKKRFVSFVMLM